MARDTCLSYRRYYLRKSHSSPPFFFISNDWLKIWQRNNFRAFYDIADFKFPIKKGMSLKIIKRVTLPEFPSITDPILS